jgi:hypothetical protein
MPGSSESLWDAVYRVGTEDGTSDKIEPAVVANLIKLKIVKLAANGLPQLTAYGEKCYVVMESGDGEVPELDNYDR